MKIIKFLKNPLAAQTTKHNHQNDGGMRLHNGRLHHRTNPDQSWEIFSGESWEAAASPAKATPARPTQPPIRDRGGRLLLPGGDGAECPWDCGDG